MPTASISTTRRRRRCAPPRSTRCCRSCASTTPTRGACTPTGASPASRSRRRASRSRSSSTARPREIVFTSGGTEAVNAAIAGAVLHDPDAHRRRDHGRRALERARRRAGGPRRDRASSASTATAGSRADDVLDAVTDTTALVSVQLANHEVGTLQQVSEICVEARDLGVSSHVDACAAIGYAPVSFGTTGADLMSVTAHTWGGPKGTGALLDPARVAHRAVRRRRRPGARPAGRHRERARDRRLRRRGRRRRRARRGRGRSAPHRRHPRRPRRDGDRAHVPRRPRRPRSRTSCASGVEGVEAEPILLALDQQGIAIHSGSACSSESLEPSPVLAAMGADADHSLRISVGWSTTDADVDRFLAVFPGVVERLRELRT